MTTLQEQFEKDFPDKSVREIRTEAKYDNSTNYDLDLREYKNLTILDCSCNNLTSLSNLPNGLTHLKCSRNNLTSLSNLPNSLTYLDCSNNNLTSLSNLPNSLTYLDCSNNNLTSIDFLNQLPNLEKLVICDNNIQPTTLDFLKHFVNLKDCRLGENNAKNITETNKRIKENTYNKIYGSLEPIKNLTKLEQFCIAGTDVEEGIEYIPTKLVRLSAEAVKEGRDTMKSNLIDCQRIRDNAKVVKIQNQLRPFNYDIEA
jgi:Leucine-rich repeat (LRR) protein